MGVKKPKTNRHKMLAKVHIAKKELGIDDDTYRELLFSLFKVKSAKYLNDIQLKELIRVFRELGWKQKREWRKNKYESFKNRNGFANPSQLRLIESLWQRVSYSKNKNAALNNFLESKFKISHILFLSDEKAQKVIDALKDMYVRKCFESACKRHNLSDEKIKKLRKFFWKKLPDNNSLKDEILKVAELSEARQLMAASERLLIEIFYEYLKDLLRGDYERLLDC